MPAIYDWLWIESPIVCNNNNNVICLHRCAGLPGSSPGGVRGQPKSSSDQQTAAEAMSGAGKETTS